MVSLKKIISKIANSKTRGHNYYQLNPFSKPYRKYDLFQIKYKKIVHNRSKENEIWEGFTLIELLGVIIVLAIIALIATPIVLNVIDEARESADMSSAKFIENSGYSYYGESLLDEEKQQ